ncbi:hypothetical protein GCK72_003354 [Caenorhabditis remanei]|uniref:DUF7154 domain-containing protein n=1 Tax=Caenorhabditis remanei TaxID=31234 RepID=A0A6A5HY27_CAERE|nr:hypothetical protein GCK72_003354 [Caenorhabditis remanei]KAF1771527.1 hypothetical protein GCK72_003354 [Caenorhabditis remanei]
MHPLLLLLLFSILFPNGSADSTCCAYQQLNNSNIKNYINPSNPFYKTLTSTQLRTPEVNFTSDCHITMYCENGSSVLTFDDTGLGKMYNSPIATGECDPTTREVTMLIQDPSENEFTYTQLLGTCLVKEKCECTAIALDSLNIGGFIDSTSPFYSQMTSSDSKLPFISVSGCTTSMTCASGYSLLLFDDTGLGKVFETLSASGQCIAKTNKWKVDTGSRVRLTTFNQMYGICVVNDSGNPPAVLTSTTIPTTTTVNAECTPSSSKTVVYAYSNDMDAEEFSDYWSYEHSWQNPKNLDRSWIKFANIRFDTVNEDSIQYHNTWDELDLSIRARLPDPSLGFNTSATGSDVLKTIEKFVDNTEAPLCGARMFIFVERYPNEVNIDRLVAKLRAHHILLFIYVTDTPTGGLHSETLYDLSSRTNGMCMFYKDARSLESNAAIRGQKLHYATNPKVSGRGSVQLPVPQVPSLAGFSFHLVVEDGPLKFFEGVNLSWIYSTWPEPMVQAVDLKYTFNYGIIDLWQVDSLSNLSMQYSYSDEKVRTVQVRLYNYDPLLSWPAYED